MTIDRESHLESYSDVVSILQKKLSFGALDYLESGPVLALRFEA